VTARLLQAQGEAGKALDQISQAEQAQSTPDNLLQSWKALLWLGQAESHPESLAQAWAVGRDKRPEFG